MHSCNPTNSPAASAVAWLSATENDGRSGGGNTGQTEFSIAELADEFGLTHRALRFYDTRGLLSPLRQGRRRIYTRADRARLALIVKGKKLGFTLAEISQMIEAQSGRASAHTLKLSAEKCLQQIAFFERQMREASEALAELREIDRSLSLQSAQQGGDSN